jgi:chromosome segregation ATPase
MKVTYTLPVLVLGHSAAANPLGKVFELLEDLRAKVVKDGEEEAKAYKEFFAWCDDAAANKGFEIKTATSQKAKLEAVIDESASTISEASTKIEELAADIAKGEAELAEATGIRETENAEFVKAEGELEETVGALDRAIAIIGREAAKNPGAFAQVDMSNMNNLVKTFGTVIDAIAIDHSDKKQLMAFVQSQDEDSDDDMGAPEAAAYKNKSGGIMDVLEDLKEKAESELAELRKAESSAAHNFAMTKQALEDQAAADGKDKDDETAKKQGAEETKATAEGDLTNTAKDLADAQDALQVANSNCIQVAGDHETTVASRKEEIKAIDTATKILKESTGAAVDATYSFLQIKTRADLANAEVVTTMKNLAKKYQSKAFAQLASRIEAVIRYGAQAGEDPFAKVKSMISDMLAKLEQDAQDDATEKAYCDEEMAKTEAKKADLEGDVSVLSSKLDRATSQSAKLKEEVAETQAELAALAKSSAQMDALRAEERSAYASTKADLEAGLAGVSKALGVLRDYYEGGASAASMLQDDAQLDQPAMPEKHTASSGAGGGILDLLEVVESDFSKNLAAVESAEADAVSVYEKTTQDNKVTKTMKDQDVKYKTKEFKSLDKTVSELTSDKATVSTELSAVLDYYAKLKDRCIAKPESYADRAARREAEIAGLKDALNVLENEAAFVQRKGKGKAAFLGM